MAPNLDTAFGARVRLLCLVVMTLFALALAAFWYMSPLGLGFMQWPKEEPTRSIVIWTMNASYFFGIPALILGHGAAWFFACRRKYKMALSISGVAVTFFVAAIAIVLSNLSP